MYVPCRPWQNTKHRRCSVVMFCLFNLTSWSIQINTLASRSTRLLTCQIYFPQRVKTKSRYALTHITVRPCPQGGSAEWDSLSWRCPILSVMGSDVHITAMWVRVSDDQPAACICSACLICCSPTRRDSLIDPDIHWAHITISPHAQQRKRELSAWNIIGSLEGVSDTSSCYFRVLAKRSARTHTHPQVCIS